MHVGYGLGWLAAHIPNGRSKVVKTNLRLCFPNLSEQEVDKLAIEHWKLFGRSVLERSRIWLGSGKQITDIVTIESVITLGIANHAFSLIHTLLVLKVALWHFLC